jgi:hypothetical protein
VAEVWRGRRVGGKAEVRAALLVFIVSAGTDVGTARVPGRLRVAAPGVVARLDVHMQAEEEEVVVVSTMSERMKT